MFMPDLGETFVGQSRASSVNLPFDIYPAAFATLLPHTSRPENCETTASISRSRRKNGPAREFNW